MSRLEEKLIELGYEFSHYEVFTRQNAYKKHIGDIDCAVIMIYTNKDIDKIKSYYAINGIVQSQIHINNLQQAFDVMKKDLEILKECEENVK